jgi:hypothetical protein
MVKRAICALALVAFSTGCLGTNGLGGRVKKWNLETTEHRWGREGIHLLLSVVWVHRICAVFDLFIFNSWEFWSGENPINGRRRLVDVPQSEVEKIGFEDLDRAQVELIAENEAKLHLEFRNGDRMGFDVLRDGEDYTVSYQGRVFFTGKVAPAPVMGGLQ